jgi:hypothetical protein
MNNIMVEIDYSEKYHVFSVEKAGDKSYKYECKILISQEKYNKWQKIKKAYDDMQEELELIYENTVANK